jgi:uncharacterized protein YdeI (YjbR/CyaY-like superfamily)
VTNGQPIEPVFFTSADEFEDWLEQHGAEAGELLVGLRRKASGLPTVTWPESVDAALCFGWIDGVRRGLDEQSYTIRFTPRRPGSIWSRVNTKRAQELIEQGRMRDAGLRAFESRDEDKTAIYSYERAKAELPPDLEQQFRQNEPAWSFFEGQPLSYRRPAAWWVVSAKRQETRQRRLDALIEQSAEGKRLDMLSPRAKSEPQGQST